VYATLSMLITHCEAVKARILQSLTNLNSLPCDESPPESDDLLRERYDGQRCLLEAILKYARGQGSDLLVAFKKGDVDEV
jgi:hypothetical protein